MDAACADEMETQGKENLLIGEFSKGYELVEYPGGIENLQRRLEAEGHEVRGAGSILRGSMISLHPSRLLYQAHSPPCHDSASFCVTTSCMLH